MLLTLTAALRNKTYIDDALEDYVNPSANLLSSVWTDEKINKLNNWKHW